MTPAPLARRIRSESGAIIVQVALALFAFTLLSSFVIDYGVQLVSRNQAQNVADAAALSGATALAYDSYSDRTATGPAQAAATGVAATNLVWDGQSSVEVDPNVVCADSYAAGASASPILACVQVTSHRDNAHANPIPTYIAQLMGIQSTDISATAIGEAKDANSTDCLKPLAIPDRWLERYPSPPTAWSPSSTFDKYSATPPNNPLGGAQDSYTAPDGLGAGTGMTMSDQFGTQVTLSLGSIGSPITTIKPWLYLPVQIPGSKWGPDDVRSNTSACAASKVSIGARLTFATGGTPGNATLIASGLVDLINRDPGAHWNASTQRVEGSCAQQLVGRCGSMSPRIVAVALYDPNDLATASHPPSAGATSVLVTNIIGAFVDSVSGTDVTVHLTRHPGQLDADAVTLYDNSSFLRASMLVQ